MIIFPTGLANAPAARIPWMCLCIAAICVGMLFLSGTDPRFADALALDPARGAIQPQLVSYTFLHAGLLHIAGNMLFFALVGPSVESLLGGALFAVFFLVSGAFAGLVQIELQGTATGRIVGASGAIAALMGLFIVRFARHRVKLFMWFPLLIRRVVQVPAWSFGAIWGGEQALELLFAGALSGHVAVGAHVGGFGMGAATGWLVSQLGWDRRNANPVRDDETMWQSDEELANAQQALARGDFGVAQGEFEAVLERRPASAMAAWGLAQVFFGQGRGSEAMPFVEAAFTQWWKDNDTDAVGLALAVIGRRLEPAKLRPSTLARLARELEPIDVEYARAMYSAAGQRGAERAQSRLAELEAGAAPLSAPPRRVAQLAAVRAAAPAANPVLAPAAATASDEGGTLARLNGVSATGLALTLQDGTTRVLPFWSIRGIRVGAVDLFANGREAWRNVLLTQLLIVDDGSLPRSWHLASHELPESLFPNGLPAQRAFTAFLGDLIRRSGATIEPTLEELDMGQYRRYPTRAQFEADHA